MAKAYKYSVPPFSRPHPKWDGRFPGGSDPCGICMRPINRADQRHFGVVIDGGSDWGDDDSVQDDGYMGYHPIGSDCHRRFVVKKGR